MWLSASWRRGSNASPGSPYLTSPAFATTRSSWSATAWKPVVELAVLTGPVDGVEHVDDRRERGVRRVLADQLPVAVDPALVVEVLGLEPLQVGGALGERLLELRGDRWRRGTDSSSSSSSRSDGSSGPPSSSMLSHAADVGEPGVDLGLGAVRLGRGRSRAATSRSEGEPLLRLPLPPGGHLDSPSPSVPRAVGVTGLVHDLGVDDVVVGRAGRGVGATGGGLVGLGRGVHRGAHLLAGLTELGHAGLDLLRAWPRRSPGSP